HRMGNQNLPRPAPLGDAGRQVDCVTKQVVATAKSRAVVDAHSDPQALVLGNTLVSFAESFLNGNSRTHREDGRWELRHNRLANLRDEHSAKFSNCRGNEAVVQVQQEQTGCIAKPDKIGCRTDDVGEKDGNPGLVSSELFINFRTSLKQLIDVVYV